MDLEVSYLRQILFFSLYRNPFKWNGWVPISSQPKPSKNSTHAPYDPYLRVHAIFRRGGLLGLREGLYFILYSSYDTWNERKKNDIKELVCVNDEPEDGDIKVMICAISDLCVLLECFHSTDGCLVWLGPVPVVTK